MSGDITDASDRAILSDTDLLTSFFPDAPSPLPVEPNVQPVPVVQIQYSAPFRTVMGLHRFAASSLERQMSPRWLLLLAFVIHRCPAHYTAWKQRRDVVMNRELFARCAVDFVSDAENLVSVVHPRHAAALKRWCPHQASTGSSWGRVSWELRATAFFAANNPKNFQVWHHRQELILSVFNSKTDDGSFPLATDPAHQPLESVCVPYEDLAAELSLCYNIHLDDDAKNYHLWSHRAWFIGLFHAVALRVPATTDLLPGLQTQLSLASLLDGVPVDRVIGDDEASMRAEAFESHLAPLLAVPDPGAPFVAAVGRGTVRAGPAAPSASLLAELRVTADFITRDVYNNSAWAHRLMLLRSHVMPYVQSLRPVSSAWRVVEHVVCGELRLAALCSRLSPCNESPLVYARSISELMRGVFADDADGRSRLVASHLALDCLLSSTVQPRLDAVVAEFAEHDSNGLGNGEAPLEFLKRNAFQLTAARFQIQRDVAAAAWAELSPDVQESVRLAFPAERFSDRLHSEGDSLPSDLLTCDARVKLLLSCETQAVDCLRRLCCVDSIRVKYWRAELLDLLERAY